MKYQIEGRGATSSIATSGVNPQIFSLEEMKKAAEEVLGKKGNNTDWILVSPDGKMYRGSIATMTSVLAVHHPLFKFKEPKL